MSVDPIAAYRFGNIDFLLFEDDNGVETAELSRNDVNETEQDCLVVVYTHDVDILKDIARVFNTGLGIGRFEGVMKIQNAIKTLLGLL